MDEENGAWKLVSQGHSKKEAKLKQRRSKKGKNSVAEVSSLFSRELCPDSRNKSARLTLCIDTPNLIDHLVRKNRPKKENASARINSGGSS